MHDYDSYARQKLGQAIDALEAKPGEAPGEARPLKERLWQAWLDGLHVVMPEYLSGELKQEFEQLREAFTWLPQASPGPEAGRGEEWPGTVIATLRAMSDEEAEALAARIRRLYGKPGEARPPREGGLR